ncbi:GNAT family N-acetyltransferase [Actinocatenispora rupis]|uniref:N-acetyltransferase n=1 Tax=Actinocatenispora rupis TaxID=519421 RepID=A0A8J3J4U5_9ACTN|nr:GNAT family N-acetyltransferase [Actinocatenispora rupis]GID14745.1 N-acetyltransferase [Actinocatenispora rupis]
MLFRPTAAAELDRVSALFSTGDPVNWVDAARYRSDFADRQYRPEWTWVAEERGELLALAVWWSQPTNDTPTTLDHLYVSDRVADRAGVAAGLLTAAHEAYAAAGASTPPEYQLRLPNEWRRRDPVQAEMAWRRAAVERVGLTEDLERLQYVWTADSGVPESRGRLVFEPEPSDEAFVDVFRQVSVGSLDTTTRRHVEAYGRAAAAREDLDFYLSAPATRDWWRLARDADGALVGFGIPWHNPGGPNVGYLGVLPESRGNGYIDEILVEITRFHAANGARRITATTDLVNVPMQKAFERNRYRNTEVRLILSAPVPSTVDGPQ